MSHSSQHIPARDENPTLSRRAFLRKTSACSAGLLAISPGFRLRAAASPNQKVTVGIIGCNGRGMAHIAGYLAVPNVEIGYICDVDSRAVAKGVAAVAKGQERKPRGVTDFRRMLDDPQLDAVSIATPDHWHAPAAILACKAGKHVYVEKPGSHNGHESDLLVAAARKYKRVVQMGNQRRSWPWVIEAMDALHAGELGNVFLARAWYTNHRPTIGYGKIAPVPDWLDYNLWQGPAPEWPYHDNILHYNWHWFWRWGTGELGNNGVHALDLARWGMRLDVPTQIACSGGRYHFQDDWETPDTAVAHFDFGDKAIVWEGQSCDPHGFEGASFGVNFYGEKGCMAVAGNQCKVYDLTDKLVREIKSGQGGLFQFDSVHFANFIAGIREGAPLRAEIEDGQKSTLMCHLGNIAWRCGHTIHFDPVTRKIIGDKTASVLWRRSYRPGWEPAV